MKARYLVYAKATPDGEGTYGIQAVCDVTFIQDNGTTTIIGTSITSPGLWDVAGYADDSYFDSIAEEEMDTLLDMLTALGVPNAVNLIPSPVVWESAVDGSSSAEAL